MHKQQSHIFFSYAFDKDGKGHKLRNEEVAKEVKSEGLAWVHLDGANKNSKTWLEKEVSYLDHLIIDALLAEETRPRIMEFEHGILVILRGVNLNANSQVDDMVSIRMWIDAERIISIQKRNFNAAFDIAKKIELGKTIKNPGEFLYNLIHEVLMLTAPSITTLNEAMDDVEEKVLETNHDDDLRENIIQIRKRATIFKRYFMPQKDILSRLKTNESEWINDWARRHFQENHDQISRIIEDLDEVRERSQIVHDELSNAIADRLNKNMFKVTLIASIFMPLSFITGLFGMNVKGIPWSEHPQGFFISFAMMSFLLGASILIMKGKKFL